MTLEPDVLKDLPLSVEDEVGGHMIAAPPGETLLSALQAGGISIGAVCGGGMMCATCHVFLAPATMAALPAPSDGEIELLGSSAHFDPARSRLACQVIVDSRLCGLVEVAPDD